MLIERIVFDTPSRVTDISHQRLFTGATRRMVQVRDQTCTWPGCHTPADRCHIDHITPWAHGGPTTTDNGQALCPHHNAHKATDPRRRPPP